MDTDRRNLVIWLAFVCLVVYVMITVGGITRLTQSGLSMVDWRPIMGVMPPMTQDEWHRVFDAYKEYPEYQKINRGMSLDEFKSIFYWEYGHRVLGRIIGLIYFIPFMVFLVLGRIPAGFKLKLWMGLLLGGLQGLMGWYMVKSGLVDRPSVSHYRLAAHLLLALFILGYLFWIILRLAEVQRSGSSETPRGLIHGIALLLFLQLLFGAFTAGLDAGYFLNTWPLMNGQFLADAALMMEPLWHNFLENGVMIQFVHRWLGALLLGMVFFNLFLAWQRQHLLVPSILLAGITLVQFLVGIATLVMRVPVAMGSFHQAVGALVVLAMVYLVFSAGRPYAAADHSANEDSQRLPDIQPAETGG